MFVCYWVALRALNPFKHSGIGLDLACNLTVLRFLVYTLHGSNHCDLISLFPFAWTCSVLIVDAVFLFFVFVFRVVVFCVFLFVF